MVLFQILLRALGVFVVNPALCVFRRDFIFAIPTAPLSYNRTARDFPPACE